MADLPFDLAKMDYDGIRLRLRRKLLRWSIVPMVFLFAGSLWYILPYILAGQASRSYNRHDYNAARQALAPTAVFDPVQYVTLYNKGTNDAQLARYDQSETELNRALAYAPPKFVCRINQNLVLSIEAHANDLLVHAKAHDAVSYYTRAIAAVNAHPDCHSQAEIDRLNQEKRIAQDQEAAQSKKDTNTGDQSSTTSDGPSQTQQQQLDASEQQAQQRQVEDTRKNNTTIPDPTVDQW